MLDNLSENDIAFVIFLISDSPVKVPVKFNFSFTLQARFPGKLVKGFFIIIVNPCRVNGTVLGFVQTAKFAQLSCEGIDV